MDVSNEESVRSCFAKVKEHLGEQKLYGLVNNAGIANADNYEDIITTNVYGPKLVTEVFAELLD